MKLGQVKILDTINKIPGGLMVVPLILGVTVNTLFPDFLKIGSFTTALFKNGGNCLIAVLFLCSGAQIQFRSAGQALYKGVVINTSKVLFGVSIGVILARIGGPGAVMLGMTPLGLIGCMSNSNGGLYTALATKYGDKPMSAPSRSSLRTTVRFMKCCLWDSAASQRFRRKLCLHVFSRSSSA